MKIFGGESEEDRRAMIERFVEACKRRDLKENSGKIKVMVLERDEGAICAVIDCEWE